MDDSMKDPPIPSFKSIEEECAYWKNRCSGIKKKLIDTKQEFTKQIRDLKNANTQMQSDNECLRKKITTFKSNYLQHFSTHLTLVERVQNEVEKLDAIELETTTVKTEPQEEEPSKSKTTNAKEVKAAAVAAAAAAAKVAQEDSDDSTSTVSHISEKSLEELVALPCDSNLRKSLNLSTDENEPILDYRRHSRSKLRCLTTKEHDHPSSNNNNNKETGKRKRDKSNCDNTAKKAKKAQTVTLKRVANSSPNRMEYEIANSPHNIERENRGKRIAKEPIASTSSTQLRSKNDQSSITNFFKKANTCAACGTFSKDSAYLKFHENFHLTRECPGCSIKFVNEENFDVTKHIACYLLKSKLSKAQLIRMNGMQVTVSKLPHEQIRKEEPKCCTEKLTTKSMAKDRKRQASTHHKKSKEPKANRKDRDQTNKSSLNVDIDAPPRDERKKSKSKSSTTDANGTLTEKDDSIEIDDIGDISIPLNWNAEMAKDKVFWIRSFGSDDPIYVPIRRKKVSTNEKLTKSIQIIDDFAKRASETTVPNLQSTNATPKTPQHINVINAQAQSSPRAVQTHNNRSASVLIPVSGAFGPEIIARTDSQLPTIRLLNGKQQPSRIQSSPVPIQTPNNNGIITCIQKSALLNTHNPSDMTQKIIVPKQAGLINARRKSVAAEITRIAMNKNYHQVNSLAPPRRFSVCLEQRPNVPNQPINQMQAYYQPNTSTIVPNTGAISLRSINSDHSYTGPNQSDRMQTNQPQNRQIRPKVTYSLQNIMPLPSLPPQQQQQQSQLMPSIARDSFLPSPFPVNTSTITLIAPAINNPTATQTQCQQPKKTQLKVLTVADLNAKLLQPIAQLDNSNASDVQVDHSNGISVSKPRMKLTPIRPQTAAETNVVVPDTEAISVSLSKIQDEQIELTLNIRDQRIDYESLNERQKADVKNCLLRNCIWKEMLMHIKQGKPTQDTLNLFKKILPAKERQEFFENFYKR